MGRAVVGSIADKTSGDMVFKILSSSLKYERRDYVALVAYDHSKGKAFPVLVGIILSQNTNDKNSIRAFETLARDVGIDPALLAETPLDRIEQAIRVAGLTRQKARAIRGLARLVLEKGEDYLLREDPWRLKEELKKIKGIGDKTIDVFLSLVRKAGVFAVDTHAARIAKRWGLVGERASYREISEALLSFFGPERSEEAHRLLIALGRTYCRARDPRCMECPLREICPSARQR